MVSLFRCIGTVVECSIQLYGVKVTNYVNMNKHMSKVNAHSVCNQVGKDQLNLNGAQEVTLKQ